ncbi:Uncharacterised protein [Mycobacterium tuberculosis]|uniref:Uncharacterized protein n=1 Tax=Mycobacterium tuberculosis TaxID=1773 RepID=A0A655JI51_MYCTX|nr:Uncharacterised protein [Mycobacterium tuberculosis]COW96740.1 Uncharacterised protein [Mycobacterium tuberculosis]
MDQHPVSLLNNEVNIAQRGLCPRGAASVFVADAHQFERRRVLGLIHPDDRGRHRGGVDHIGVIRRIAQAERAVGGIGFVVVVRDVHQGGPVPLRQTRQHGQQSVPALLVNHGGDLVGDEHRRLPGQRCRQRQALQLTTGQASGVAFGKRFQADLAQQPANVSGGTQRQPPHHVVGNPGAQDLAFRMLQDDSGAAQLSQTHRARTIHGARRRCPAGQYQHQGGLP